MNLRVRINWTPRDPQLRRFGWIGLVAFFLIGAAASLVAAPPDAQGIRVVFGILAVASGLFARFSPKRLKPIYLLTMCLGAVVGQVLFLILYPLIRLMEMIRGREWLKSEAVIPEGEWWFRIGPAISRPAVEWSDPGNFDGNTANIPEDGRLED